MRMDINVVASRLKEARERKNLKQTQVKERTGGVINNKTLSGYERGTSEPDLTTLGVLADLYDVTVDWILGKTDRYQKLSNEAQQLADSLELSDHELIDKFNFTLDGEGLSEEEVKRIVAYIRLERQLKNNN